IGAVKLAKSIHPGLASRSFAFDSTGQYLVSADRPDNKVKVYNVNADTGVLDFVSDFTLPQPAFIVFAEN
ncbi:lactonase family protein, partial [Salmonella enterica]|nr:lactonase family protein [Salmonella enterica]